MPKPILKKCSKCKEIKTISEFYKDGYSTCEWCKVCSNKKNKEYYKKFPEKYYQWATDWKKRNPNKVKESAKKYIQKLRLLVLQAYGGKYPKCSCCEESEINFLTIDHISGNGNKHRKTLTTTFYSWLRKNNYPGGFQVLCYNCNMAKGHYGICPHKLKCPNPS